MSVTGRDRVTALLFYGVLLLLGYLVFRVFEPFLIPLGWAGVLVVLFYPWHAHLERLWGRTPGAAVSTLGVTLILILPALLLMTAFVREGIEAAQAIQKATAQGQLPGIDRAWEWVQQRVPVERRSDLASLARQGAERMASFLASRAGAVLRNVAVFFFDLAVSVFALFYLFRDAGAILDRMRRLLPFERQHRERMIAEARDLIFASVTSSLIVAGVQGALGGLAFASVGIGAPVFWGVVMAFFSLLPVVGAWIIWVPAAIWLFLNGQVGRGVVLVAVCAGVVGLVDNFLRPALISGRGRLSGLVVFISVLGGISVFGLLGVVLGPIVVAAAAGLLEIYTERREGAGAT